MGRSVNGVVLVRLPKGILYGHRCRADIAWEPHLSTVYMEGLIGAGTHMSPGCITPDRHGLCIPRVYIDASGPSRGFPIWKDARVFLRFTAVEVIQNMYSADAFQ